MCAHEDFRAECRTERLTETDGGPVVAYRFNVTVKCTHCGAPFAFRVQPGPHDKIFPALSPDGLLLSIPIVPVPELDITRLEFTPLPALEFTKIPPLTIEGVADVATGTGAREGNPGEGADSATADA